MRPQLHLTAPSGWVNDPHGITVHEGRYHLFHQYVPDSLVHLPACHWGHAVSDDLVSWEHRPTALSPGEGDDGIWTGSLVQGAEGPRILYTSVRNADYGQGRVRLATPTDTSWDTWRKGEVVIEFPTDLDLIAFRDPFVVANGAGWRLFVGAGDRAGTAMALTYTSTDLEHWTYDGVAASRSTHVVEPVWTGALWECPQVVEIDGRAAMVTSIWDDDVLHYVAYGVGTCSDGQFHAEHWARLSFGASYYAPSFFRDADGEPCLMFWMRGVHDEIEGWAGTLSIPYRIALQGERLVATPHPTLAAARADELDAAALADVGETPVDVAWLPEPGDVLTVSDGGGATVELVTGLTELVLHRRDEPDWRMSYDGSPIRVVVDGPTIEISTADGVLGGPIRPGGTIVAEGRATAWSLLPRAGRLVSAERTAER